MGIEHPSFFLARRQPKILKNEPGERDELGPLLRARSRVFSVGHRHDVATGAPRTTVVSGDQVLVSDRGIQVVIGYAATAVTIAAERQFTIALG
jgi:hypothetical protein